MKRLAFTLGLVSVILALTASPGAQTNTLVLPREAVDVFGDSFANVFQTPVEQIYSRDEFPLPPGASISITQIAFRGDYPGANRNLVYPHFIIKMGTFSGGMDEIPNNQFVGPLTNVFERSNFTISLRAPVIPQEFPIQFTLDRPYLYNPRNGQLMILLRDEWGGEPGIFDFHFVDAKRGRFIYSESDRLVPGRGMIVSEFTFVIANPILTKIDEASESLKLTINRPVAGMLVLESSPVVQGAYTVESGVVLEAVSDQIIRATLPRPKTNTFYRVRLE